MPPNPLPRISEAEWTVMKLAWSRAPLSSADIVDALTASENWHPKTIRTLVNRLVKKGALGFEKQGRSHLYYPRIKETDCIAAVSESFLDRVFGGALKPMFAHFARRKRLSAQEVEELKRVLEGK